MRVAGTLLIVLLLAAVGGPAVGSASEPPSSLTQALLAQDALSEHPDAVQALIDEPTFAGIWINDEGQLAFTPIHRAELATGTKVVIYQ